MPKGLASGIDTQNFELSYNTLSLPASASEDEKYKSKRDEQPKVPEMRVFTGLESTGVVLKVPKVTPEPKPKRKRTLERPTKLQETSEVVNMDTNVGDIEFKTARKFSANSVNILKDKAARSIKVQNKYQILTYTESDSEEPITQKPSPTIRKPKNNTAAKNAEAKSPKIATKNLRCPQ